MFGAILVCSYRDLYGKKLPLSEARSRIKSYPLFTVISTLSLIDTFIHDLSYEGLREDFGKNQLELFERLSSDKQKELINKLCRDILANKRGVFGRPQLTKALKMAFKHCREVTSLKGDMIPLHDLLDALLIINDHFGPSVKDHPPIYYIYLKETQFNFRDDLEQSLARWVLLAEKAMESSIFPALDLKNRYRAKYGLDIKNYLIIGYFIYWTLAQMTHDPEHKDIDDYKIFFSIDQLKPRIKIGEDEFERAFEEFCQPPEYFKREISAQASIDEYDNVPLLKTPLVRFGDGIFCLSRHFLAMKLSLGFYWMLVNLYEGSYREDVMSLFGEVFEEYIDELFERIYGSPPLSSFIPAKYIKFAEGRNKADAFIDCGNALITIEYKSSPIPLKKVLASKDGLGKFHDWEDDNIIEAARQIHDVIDQIKNEKIPGFSASRIKKYYPLVITLQYLPTPSPDYLGHVNEKLKEENDGAGILQDEDIGRINIISVNELEAAEAPLSEQGVTLKEMINLKNSDDRTYYDGWLGFLQTYYNKLTNNYLMEEFKRIAKSGISTIFTSQESSD